MTLGIHLEDNADRVIQEILIGIEDAMNAMRVILERILVRAMPLGGMPRKSKLGILERTAIIADRIGLIRAHTIDILETIAMTGIAGIIKTIIEAIMIEAEVIMIRVTGKIIVITNGIQIGTSMSRGTQTVRIGTVYTKQE